MTNFKKLMSLLMVLAMLVTFAAPTFADGEDQPVQKDHKQEYGIEFKFSDDIVNLKPEDLKVFQENNTYGDGLKTAKAGDELTIFPADFSNFSWNSYYNYYYDGKKIENRNFTMPDHDVVIYVTTKTYKADNFIVSKATSQPTGWVTVTVDAGKHGGFMPQPWRKGDQPYKNETFYVNPLYEVEIIERNQAYFDVAFFDTDLGYKLKDTSKVKGIFEANTNKTLEYDKYPDYKVTLHKYGTDETEVLNFAPTATYEEVLNILRSKETSNPPQGQKFAGWLGEEKDGKRTIYALDKKYDGYNFIEELYFNNPTYEGELEDLDLYEVYTPNHIVYKGGKRSNDKLTLYEEEAYIVEDGETVSLYGNDFYEYNLKTKSFDTEKFNKETKITKDYFLGTDYSGRSEKAKIKIIGEPQYNYKEMAEPKIDLSKMLVGIINYDAKGRRSTTYVHPKEFAAKGIKLNYTDGQNLTGEDNGKYIKVTYTENRKDYFIYTKSPLDVVDDGFDKDNIKSITVTNSSTGYQISESENTKYYLDNLEVELTAANKDNTQADVVRKVSYKDFDKYGLKVKLVDGEHSEDIDSNTIIKLEHNGKKLVVYWDKAGKDVKAEIGTLNIVDKDKAKKEALAAKKTELLKEIDDAKLKDPEAVKKLKEKVNAATIDTDLDALTQEIKDAIQEEKIKENFDQEKDKLKKEITASDLDAKVKDALNAKIDALTDPKESAKLLEIKKEFEAAKELKVEKDKAKEEIGKLPNLSKDEVDNANKAVDAAADKKAVEKALEDAKKLSADNTAKKEALEKAKEEAKTAIGKLDNLSDDDKTKAVQAVEDAKDQDGVKKALDAAKEKDAKIKAEKALVAKKTELLKEIEDANLKDPEAVKKLKEKVNAATIDTDLDKLTQEIKDAIQEEKIKENFDQEKDKLKEEITASDLDTKVKDALNAKIDALTKPEESAKLLDIKKEFEAAKELKSEKDKGKEEIKNLPNLSKDEIDNANKAVDAANNKDEVKKALDDAKKLSEYNTAKIEAEKKAAEAKEAAKKAEQEAEEAKKAAEKAEQEAEEAKKTADKAKEDAEAKAKELEKAKEIAEKAAEDAKKAEEAAKDAKEKAEAEPNNADLAEKAKEAKDAEEKAKQEAKEAEEKAEKAAEEAKTAEDKVKEDVAKAENLEKEAENKAKEAKEAVEKAKKAEEKAKEAEKNIPATADEKEEAKKEIDNLSNLSSSEKNIYKNKVDQATTKGEVAEALEEAKKYVSPILPGYHGYFYEGPSPKYLDNGYTPRKEEPKKEEPKKEEVKEEKKDISKTLYFYLDKYFYEIDLNGTISQIPMDVAPTAINQRTMLPIRFVAEAIGATVEWHQDTKSATFTKDGITATITLGKDEITVSDGRTIKMDAEPTVISQRIMVPLTNISQIFGLTNGDLKDGVDNDIEWDQENYRVIIKIKK